MPVRFLSTERVLRIHQSVIEAYGGSEGLRSAELLHSALGVPEATFGGEFLHADLFEMAAAYLFHITQNHPFVDGNKRTGAAAAVVFLALNNVSIRADEEGLVDITLQVATGQAQKAEVAAFFRALAEPDT
jgi:death on curing protein